MTAAAADFTAFEVIGLTIVRIGIGAPKRPMLYSCIKVLARLYLLRGRRGSVPPSFVFTVTLSIHNAITIAGSQKTMAPTTGIEIWT
jgi:hypothetical protein